jgi:hypothetical protein
MNHENFRVSKDGHLFLHIVYRLTLNTFVAALFHLFGLDITVDAFTHIDVPCVSNCLSWYTHLKVHESIKRVAFVPT